MKPLTVLPLVIITLLASRQVMAQTETINLVSYKYFEGMNLADSMMIDGHFEITIAPKEVKIISVSQQDSSQNELYLQRRTMSGIQYKTLDGRAYRVWKLGDRKMVLREDDGRTYLSLYRTNDYGLPAEYITFVIDK